MFHCKRLQIGKKGRRYGGWLWLIGLMLSGVVTSQEEPSNPASNPIVVEVKHYVIDEVISEDGERLEHFRHSRIARPGQIVEYRLLLRNEGERNLPVGTVVVSVPIPEKTHYVPNSATPTSAELLTEFSLAATEPYFMQPPLIRIDQEVDSEQHIVVAPEEYGAIRWTLLRPLAAGAQHGLFYRVQVKAR